jgi:hypothetical protein
MGSLELILQRQEMTLIGCPLGGWFLDFFFKYSTKKYLKKQQSCKSHIQFGAGSVISFSFAWIWSEIPNMMESNNVFNLRKTHVVVIHPACFFSPVISLPTHRNILH